MLFNNDFSSGIPDEYRTLADDQTLVPSLDASWAIRKKSSHFKLYEETAKEFTKFLILIVGLLILLTEDAPI